MESNDWGIEDTIGFANSNAYPSMMVVIAKPAAVFFALNICLPHLLSVRIG